MSHPEIQKYYEQLAAGYDDRRFANSYGRFIDRQERAILDRHLSGREGQRILDLACGTGRLMEYCTDGLDLSSAMLDLARRKHPAKNFHLGNALHPELPDRGFDAVICFHLLMHLKKEDLAKVLTGARTLLKSGGLFIFDLPSGERRRIRRRQVEGWHGANSYEQTEVRQYLEDRWEPVDEQGILFLPIHRFPNRLRPLLLGLDRQINRTPFKKYSSYRVYILRKK